VHPVAPPCDVVAISCGSGSNARIVIRNDKRLRLFSASRISVENSNLGKLELSSRRSKSKKSFCKRHRMKYDPLTCSFVCRAWDGSTGTGASGVEEPGST
jgi:hypothetical protein